jgi:hypothetical protein
VHKTEAMPVDKKILACLSVNSEALEFVGPQSSTTLGAGVAWTAGPDVGRWRQGDTWRWADVGTAAAAQLWERHWARRRASSSGDGNGGTSVTMTVALW